MFRYQKSAIEFAIICITIAALDSLVIRIKTQDINAIKKTWINTTSLAIPLAWIWKNKNAIEIIIIRAVNFRFTLSILILNTVEKKSIAIANIAKDSTNGIKTAKFKALKKTLFENTGADAPNNPNASDKGKKLAIKPEIWEETKISKIYAPAAYNIIFPKPIFGFLKGICLVPLSANIKAKDTTNNIVYTNARVGFTLVELKNNK